MRSGWNPVRRNRNIGTTKQGYGQDNELSIPQPADTYNSFYERFVDPDLKPIIVHGRSIPVVIESLREGYYYSCTRLDVQQVLNQLDQSDLEGFGIVIFRQPKKKEAILSSVWGRLIYSYKFKDDYYPAIIIEAISDEWTSFSYPRKQSVDSKLEFELLKADGLIFRECKRDFVANFNMELARSIQLYRTLLHEIGHYVHYLEVVERPGNEDEDFEVWEERNNRYFSIPKNEKESFANAYAVRKKGELTKSGDLPFPRLEDI